MKKNYVKVLVFIIFINGFFLIIWPYRLGSVLLCGSGILIILMMLASFLHNKNNGKIKCKNCKSLLDKRMKICPYCGVEIEGRGKTI